MIYTNNTLLMRKLINLFCFSLVLLSFTKSWSQQKHFIFLQSENRKPFSVWLNHKQWLSSQEGILIVSKLEKGTHPCLIKFTTGAEAQQLNATFSISTDSADRGFLIKKFNDEWQLFDLQNFVFVKQDEEQKAEAKTDTLPTPSKKEELPVVVPEKNAAPALVNASNIYIIEEKKSSAGIDRIYVDERENGADTISVFIPQESSKPAYKAQPVINDTAVVCNTAANQDAFIKFRLDLASAETEQQMIAKATKKLESTCLSVMQVKNLCTLFLDENLKLSFVKLCYAKTVDKQNWPRLEKEFTDPKLVEACKQMQFK